MYEDVDYLIDDLENQISDLQVDLDTADTFILGLEQEIDLLKQELNNLDLENRLLKKTNIELGTKIALMEVDETLW